MKSAEWKLLSVSELPMLGGILGYEVVVWNGRFSRTGTGYHSILEVALSIAFQNAVGRRFAMVDIERFASLNGKRRFYCFAELSAFEGKDRSVHTEGYGSASDDMTATARALLKAVSRFMSYEVLVPG